MSRTRTFALAVSLTLAGCVAQSGPGRASKGSLVDPDAVLPPQSLLQDDSVTALTHNRSASRLAYVGVWAADAERCAMMDQTAFDGFAVITPDSIRQPGESCTFEPGVSGESSLRFEASCKKNGKTSQRPILVDMINSQSLRLTNAPGQPGAKMIRCHLQPGS